MGNQNTRTEIVDSLNHDELGNSTLIPFSYIGGKFSHLNWLLPLLPETKSYTEPFGGSGVTLLNRQQSDVETFNDLYSDVVQFFRAVRDHPDELIEQLSLTPYSEEEFELAKQRDDSLSAVEQARRFFIVVNMAYNNNINSGSWSYNCNYSSRGVSKKVSSFQAKLGRLKEISNRLDGVQITNRNAFDVIKTFDSETNLFYCDPPYTTDVRTNDIYAVEMNMDEQKELCELLVDCKSDIALSAYRNPLYDNLLLSEGWDVVLADEKKLSATPMGEGSTTQEALYVNYEITSEMKTAAFQ